MHPFLMYKCNGKSKDFIYNLSVVYNVTVCEYNCYGD